MDAERKRILSSVKTIVVKVGTALLTDSNSRLDRKRIKRYALDISSLIEKGYKVVLVTSGAVAAGAEVIFKGEKPSSLPQKQAAASVGQIRLMQAYQKEFEYRNIHTAQLLLSELVLRDRLRYLNAKNTIGELLQRGVVPIVNENDTISTEELRFGDNDFLGSMVATLAEAEMYIILTDTEGVYKNYNKENQTLIEFVCNISSELKEEVSSKTTKFSTGGMLSKLRAMEVAMKAGIMGIIASGKKKDTLSKIVLGEKVGTVFLPSSKRISHRKKWLLNTVKLKGKGSIVIDEGAAKAIVLRGKSLLPGGIISSSGKFMRGDAVNIYDKQNELIAQGLVNYSREDIEAIKGLKTSKIESVLGRRDYEEVVHRDNLILQ